MKRFIFRYERLLQLRMDHEEDVKNKLSEANAELQKATQLKLDLEAELARFQQYFMTQMESGVNAGDFQVLNSGKKHIQDKQEQVDLLLGDIRLRVAQIKIELAEAMKERKIMEKLKEREQESYYEAVNSAENKQIEEIVNYQSSKKRGDQ